MLIFLHAGLAACSFSPWRHSRANYGETIAESRFSQAAIVNLISAFVRPSVRAPAALVWAADRALPEIPTMWRLVALLAVGGLSYTAMPWLGARQTIMEVANLLIRRKPPAPVTP